MITDIEAERLIVISDLHLGSPFCNAKEKVIKFLYWASSQGYDICINGDGLEIAQVSFRKMIRDVPDVFHALKSVTKNRRNMYYVVGNHDIIFENFIEDWGAFKMAPFLNVTSGTSRIRIEHGHLYDPFFIRNPNLYELCTWLAGFFIKVHPGIYKLWITYEKLKSTMRMKRGRAIVGEHPHFAQAANELANRGFDAVIFGHTHHVGEIELEGGKRYLNPGSWLFGTSFVEINKGVVSLRTWEGT